LRTTVLVVEDEAAIADVVGFALRKSGFETFCATTLAAAREHLASREVGFVILDLGLPDGDGLDLCREVRRRSPALPVLVLTCRDEEVDRVVGLETGADDYVVKPFSTRELVARVRAILRRAGAPASTDDAPLAAGRLVLDPSRHQVMVGARPVPLTPVEFQLLRALLAAPGHVLTRDHLIDRAYGGDTFVSDRTIDSHVKGIRRRFAAAEAEADPIETVFGVGYRIRALP
jgi:two-component system catabolic regulation response regulator CreB